MTTEMSILDGEEIMEFIVSGSLDAVFESDISGSGSGLNAAYSLSKKFFNLGCVVTCSFWRDAADIKMADNGGGGGRGSCSFDVFYFRVYISYLF